MEKTMVCTAAIPVRQGCSRNCGGCGHLRMDRRDRSTLMQAAADFGDRRRISNLIPMGAALALAGGGSVAAERSAPETASLLLGLLVLFNILDVFLTLRAFSMGVAEANPVMAGLFSMSLPAAIAAKLLFVLCGGCFLWKFRHLPLAARGMKFLTWCYGAVIAYHLAFQALTF